MKLVATNGGCKWIVSLLESDHNIMINEGLIATSLLAALNSGNSYIYVSVFAINTCVLF